MATPAPKPKPAPSTSTSTTASANADAMLNTNTTKPSQPPQNTPQSQRQSQSQNQNARRQGQKPSPPGGKPVKQSGPANHKGPSAKLRGLEKDSPAVRLSKTLSWLLRHGAKGEGLPMREDGYVKATDLFANPKIKSQGLTLDGLKAIVQADAKKRYDLTEETPGVWWIRANQGHSMKTVKVDLKPILAASDIPTGVAVHGTTKKAWESIAKEGLSKMNRNHIHLAQGVPGDNIISGMRNSSQVLIFVDVQKALDAGIKFHFSDNGVVLTEGNDKGLLGPEFFEKVEDAKLRVPLTGWEGVAKKASASA